MLGFVLAASWIGVGIFVFHTSSERAQKILVRALRLVPGFREEMLRSEDGPGPLALLFCVLGWPILLWSFGRMEKALVVLQEEEDARILRRRLPRFEQHMTTPPLVIDNIPTSFLLGPEDAHVLQRFLGAVQPRLLELDMEHVVSLPTKELPLAALYRTALYRTKVRASVGIRLGKIMLVSTWADGGGCNQVHEIAAEVAFPPTGDELRTSTLTWRAAQCGHCFVGDSRGYLPQEWTAEERVVGASFLAELMHAVSTHNKQCPHQQNLDKAQIDVRDALGDDPEGLRSALRQVDDAVGDERPTVVDANGDGAAGVDVGDQHAGPKGHGLAHGGREPGTVEVLSVCGEVALEPGAVPAGAAAHPDVAGAGGQFRDSGGRAASSKEQGADADDGATDDKSSSGPHKRGA